MEVCAVHDILWLQSNRTEYNNNNKNAVAQTKDLEFMRHTEKKRKENEKRWNKNSTFQKGVDHSNTRTTAAAA